MGNVAALDCGSNSTRLLICDEDGTALRREMTITRLSQGVDASGMLAAEALQRSYDTLARYREFMDAHNVDRGLLVATSAVRDAVNGAEFLSAASEIIGVTSRILSGNEEATFSFAGATADLEPHASTDVILDIGGGSTEIAGRIGQELVSYSMQLGCVRVTERALGKEVVTPEREAAALAMINEQLQLAFAKAPEFESIVGNVRLIGLAGTVATLAKLATGEAEYLRERVHHQTLTSADVRHWRDSLSSMSPEERLRIPAMVPGREDVLHAGLYILLAVMERFQIDELLTSENDILDGIAASLL